MNRAYSILNVKSVDEARRVITGIATTPSLDRVGDIIEPLGVKFTNPMPFLWQHRHDQPIGTCEFGRPTANGIPFTATIANPPAAGVLKDRCDEAWQSIHLGLVRATSVGFRPIEYSHMDGGGIRYTEVEVFELSAVTIPANADAIIEAVKSADAASRRRPAAKATRVVRLTPEEMKRASLVGQSLVRIARARALGIPAPVVKL